MKSDQDLYRQLRGLPAEKLWNEEVARFDRAAPKERNQRVAIIRAVGVVFAASGTVEQKAEVKAWLVRLLQDPNEKVRRYAMAAIPKIRVGPGAEEPMVALLKTTASERERRHLGRALDKIGGRATLEAVAAVPGLLPQTEQKAKARVARAERPSVIRLDRVLSRFDRLRIHLRCRKGVENLVREEVEEYIAARGKFRIMEVRGRYVAITPTAPFSLSDLYMLRCFSTVGFALGIVRPPVPADASDALAAILTSPASRRILETCTEGAIRYRLEFMSRGHQRGAVRQLANRVYARCPDVLNDPRRAPWSMDIHETPRGTFVELRPRLSPDPRMWYRRDDVPAASHPPLAACMARLAGRTEGDVVWDPFCGSGLELIERALRGGVSRLMGTDISPKAIAIAQANVAAAKLGSIASTFAGCDFRDFARVEGLGPGSVTLMITNPPMGRRVRIPDLRGLFTELFAVAASALRPGGRFVLANPLRLEPRDPSLKLEYRQVIDLGGFSCFLEKYRKAAP